MDKETIVLIILAGFLLLSALLIGIGKGDWLISGYNTASSEKRTRYNILRLRLSVVISCVLIAILVILDALNLISSNLFTVLTIIIAVAQVVVGNTWARRE